MDSRRPLSGNFFREIQLHNPWWVDELGELAAVSEFEPRSDVYKLLENLDAAILGNAEERIFFQYGQRGVGKTTALKQLVATCVDDSSVGIDVRTDELHREELRLENELAPTQILYVPVEEALYHLEPSYVEDQDRAALDRIEETIRRFASRHGQREELILLDDLGVLELNPDDRAEVLGRCVSSGSAMVITGTLPSHVRFPDTADEAAFAFPQLPRKFIDTAKSYDESLRRTLRKQQADETEGCIHHIRERLATPAPETDPDLETIVEWLETLYFEVFSDTDRRVLARLAQEYLVHGGFFYETPGEETHVREAMRGNELVEAALELFLYRDVAETYGVSKPRNLHRLSAYAAQYHDEYRYRDLAEWLGVDRRTVKDRYVSVLEDATILRAAPKYSLVRQHQTRLHLQNPRHVILLSQRQANKGFAPTYRTHDRDPVFEGLLARTAAFDHARRLQFHICDPDTEAGRETTAVEYAHTDEGPIDMVLRSGRYVYPAALAYDRSPETARDALRAFDPATGKHRDETANDGHGIETLDLAYEAPIRFVVADTVPYRLQKLDRLVDPDDPDGPTICYLPLWLFLLLG